MLPSFILSLKVFAVDRDKLDGALRNDSKFPDPFQVIFDVQFLHAEAQQSARVWDNLPRETTTPLPCFSTVSEQQKALEVYGKYSVHSSVGFGFAWRFVLNVNSTLV